MVPVSKTPIVRVHQARTHKYLDLNFNHLLKSVNKISVDAG